MHLNGEGLFTCAHRIYRVKSFAATGNRRTRRRQFGKRLEKFRRQVNVSPENREIRRTVYLAGKHVLTHEIRPSAVPIYMRGSFSIVAMAAAQAFLDHKRRHPSNVPLEQLSPLQKRMQSGSV